MWGFCLLFININDRIYKVIILTINEILIYCINKLKNKNIEEPILKAKILVSYNLKKEKEYLIINGEKELKSSIIAKIKEDIYKVENGMPIQYITNNQEFMGFKFFVDQNVLIPQPDTETLVEEVIKLAKKINANKILDLCTGSGAIAISIAKTIDAKKIVASDVSKEALKVAELNCNKNNTKNVSLIYSDMFDNINDKFDIIVSNPPYIKTETIGTLSAEVKKEPKIALDGGKDGLEFYRRIVNKAYDYLENGGYLCMEIGYDQKDEVISILELNGRYCDIYSKKDLTGNDRIIICKKE